MWDILNKESYLIYINRDIDLKIKIYEISKKDEIYMNYKGFNLTIPMLVWEFGEDLSLASIEDVRIEGEDHLTNTLLLIEKTEIDFWMRYTSF